MQFSKLGSWFLIILLAFSLPVVVPTQMTDGGTWLCHVGVIDLSICAELGLYGKLPV